MKIHNLLKREFRAILYDKAQLNLIDRNNIKKEKINKMDGNYIEYYVKYNSKIYAMIGNIFEIGIRIKNNFYFKFIEPYK